MSDRVSVSFGMTLNLGNYESARLDATFATDVNPDESVEEAYERAWNIVDEQIAAKTEQSK